MKDKFLNSCFITNLAPRKTGSLQTDAENNRNVWDNLNINKWRPT